MLIGINPIIKSRRLSLPVNSIEKQSDSENLMVVLIFNFAYLQTFKNIFFLYKKYKKSHLTERIQRANVTFYLSVAFKPNSLWI